jgi:hypothetical protein
MQIQDHHVRLEPGLGVEGFDGAGRDDQLHLRRLLNRDGQPLAIQRMVIDDGDPDHRGPHKVTRVPRPGTDQTVARPPTSRIRPRIDWAIPKPPAGTSGSKPQP